MPQRIRGFQMSWRLLLAFLSLSIMHCGEDCRKLIQGGDFEFSQGNAKRALALYERALQAGGCPDAEAKKKAAEAAIR